ADPAAALAARHARQVDAEFAREQAHRRARVRHLVGQQLVGIEHHRRRARRGGVAVAGIGASTRLGTRGFALCQVVGFTHVGRLGGCRRFVRADLLPGRRRLGATRVGLGGVGGLVRRPVRAGGSVRGLLFATLGRPVGGRFDHRDHGAFADLVADLDLQLAHDTRERRRHFHRRLVGLERHQPLVDRDGIAHRHQHLDHRHAVVAADIGDACFLQLSHARLRPARKTLIVAAVVQGRQSLRAGPPCGNGQLRTRRFQRLFRSTARPRAPRDSTTADEGSIEAASAGQARFMRPSLGWPRLPGHRPAPPYNEETTPMKRIHTLTLALLAIAPAAAFAQDTTDTSDKRWAVVGGYALAEPTGDTTVAGQQAELDGDGAATLSASYYVTDNIAVEAWGAADKFSHRVNTANGKAGSVEAQPYAVSGQYHFGTSAQTVRPFVGLGYYESNYDGEEVEPTGDLAGQRLG